MKTTKLPALLGFLFCLLMLVASGQADTFMKQVNNTDAVEMMGQKQPARSDTSTAWYTTDKACMIDSKGNTVVYRADEGVMYLIDHNKKTYAEVPLTWLSDAAAEAKDSAAAETAGPMGGMMKFEVSVTPTEETKQIKDWDTRKYTIEVDMGVGKVTTDTWTTSDIEIDASAFMAMNNAQMAIFEDFAEGMEQMTKVEGVPVSSSTEVMMMGSKMTSSTELLEVADKEAPDGIYDVPEGYEKTDVPNPMGQ
jgi:hypothetical protein